MQKLGIVVMVLLILSLTIGGYNLFMTFGGKWTCVTEECVDYATGDEWVAMNCRPDKANGNLFCNLTMNDQTYQAPLSIINLSHPAIKTCKQYICNKEVFVR